MKHKKLQIDELSIKDLFWSNEKVTYQIPIYQRNYAWGEREITLLILDIYDAFNKNKTNRATPVYYIGTLVTYHRRDKVYEVIDGQQRLTTIRILLSVLGKIPNNKLTYKSRKRSEETLQSMPVFDIEERDEGIIKGYEYAQKAMGNIEENEMSDFIKYFLENVHIVHYRVPKDVDLNHYFEVMNSRGEQLEKHEIVKAELMSRLYEDTQDDDDQATFKTIWDACSDMSTYVQEHFKKYKHIFGDTLNGLECTDFDAIKGIVFPIKVAENDDISQTTGRQNDEKEQEKEDSLTIKDMIANGPVKDNKQDENESNERFLPIIDFPNFLLIVLKLMRLNESDFKPSDFNLDDKELLNEFERVEKPIDVKQFAYTLLKARYLLDNYVVHHTREEETDKNNPWKLQHWQNESNKDNEKNLSNNKELQIKLVHLLSMFEVSFTAHQRKNYLFYCLLYLINKDNPINLEEYADFVEKLAKKYFIDVYMDHAKLNTKNTPLPGSFDEEILQNNQLNKDITKSANIEQFNELFGDGSTASKGIPQFIFNYLDYCIWKKYATEIKGQEGNSHAKEKFFNELGCKDFRLDIFTKFYFSSTRSSLEHYYPTAMADGKSGHLDEDQINCFGNYAIIGNEINSSGNSWSPKTKLDHYLDSSGKIPLKSVASLKFMIMMMMCSNNENNCWLFKDIQKHQEYMLKLLFPQQANNALTNSTASTM